MKMKKTYEQLDEQVNQLLVENERLRDERNLQADELIKHIHRFDQLRTQYEDLKNEVELIVNLIKKK
jgi:predicted nuclease with TOPRIM domain